MLLLTMVSIFFRQDSRNCCLCLSPTGVPLSASSSTGKIGFDFDDEVEDSDFSNFEQYIIGENISNDEGEGHRTLGVCFEKKGDMYRDGSFPQDKDLNLVTEDPNLRDQDLRYNDVNQVDVVVGGPTEASLGSNVDLDPLNNSNFMIVGLIL